MTNTIDSTNAVAQLALAFVEAQKDISALRRNVESLWQAVKTIDQGAAQRFTEIDNLLKGSKHATNIQRKKDTKVNEQNLRSQESEASVLRDDKRGENQGS